MKLRFHTLVWHNQVPDWFFIDKEGNRMVDETDPAKREQNKNLLLERLETHIRTIVERYRDDVDYWEVVNEVIDPGRPNGMRETEWYKITGKEFIKTAFRVTREAAGEDALLSINDYNTHQPRKRDFLFDLVMELRNEGIQVDIIGHQTHINIEYPSMELIGKSIEKFAEAGFKNHITELDISVYAYDDHVSAYNVIPDHLLDRLAIRYRDLFYIFRNLEAYIDDVTFWGIGDDHTWLHNRPVPRRDAPFLFDENLQAKDAFWAVVDPDWEP
jgi:endo-1,4-beta-xylanase